MRQSPMLTPLGKTGRAIVAGTATLIVGVVATQAANLRSEAVFRDLLAGSSRDLPALLSVHARTGVPGDSNRARRLAAFARALTDLSQARTTRHLHHAGIAELAHGSVPRAVALLSEATAAAPDSWKIQNDLAVAYLTAEGTEPTPDAVVRALDASARAVRLHPSSAIAWDTHGRAAKLLDLPVVAARSFRQAANRAIGRAHRADLLQRAGAARVGQVRDSDALRTQFASAVSSRVDWRPLAAKHPQEYYEAILERTFVEWAAAIRANDRPRAAQSREALLEAGAWQEDFSGDRLLADCAEALPASPDATSAPVLAAAHQSLANGLVTRRMSRHEDALIEFRRSSRLFRGAGSPCWLAAESMEALSTLQVEGATNAWPLIEHVRRRIAARRYHSLRARTEWTAALALVESARTDEAFAAYETAGDLFQRTGEVPNRCAVLRASADLLRTIGEYAEGWSRLRKAMACVTGDSDLLRRYLVFFEASLLAADTGLMEAAIIFQNEAVDAALERGAERTAAESLLWRGRLHAQGGHAGEAVADLNAATERARLLGPSADHFRAYVDAWASRVRAHLAAESDPAAAVRAVDRVIGFFRRHEPDEVPFLYLTRGHAQAAAGDVRSAERDWLAGLVVAEERLQRLGNAPARAAYPRVVGDLINALVLTRFQRGDVRGALATAEWGRLGRPQQDLLDTDTYLRTVQAALPDGTLLIYYATLPDRLLVWSVSRGAMSARVVEIGRTQLTAMVQTFLRELRDWRDADPSQETGVRLFPLLLSPTDLSAYSTIAIVPDGPLNLMPFAALPGLAGKGALIETHRITTHLAAADAGFSSRTFRDAPRAVIVEGTAGPAGSAPALPNVVGEIENVRRVYAHSTVVPQAEATRPAVLRAASSGEVFHFAGHARANDAFPWRSHLVVRGDSPQHQGRLPAIDIAAADFRNLELVVLAACSTSGGETSDGSGPMGVARPFILAGARAVVGTLWDVDDRSAALLLSAFHREYARTRDAAGALRAAQLALLRGADPTARRPESWAVFTVLERGR